MHLFAYKNGRLHCEEVDLEQIAAEAGTPVYVYSATTILDHYRRLREALSELDHLICYAVKANSNIAILNLLASENSGFDIVSGGELYRVIKAGGDPQQCTFAGVGKTAEEIRYALQQEILCFNVESEGELEQINDVARALGRRAPISLRVNPDVHADTHHYIATGRSENKFGIAMNRAPEVYAAAAKLSHVRIRGVQMHIGSQITSAEPFAEAIAKISGLVTTLQARYGIEFFSVGGGIGIVYEPSLASGRKEWWREQERQEKKIALTIERYAAAVLPLLKQLELRILFEPGRFIVGNAGVLVTRVLQVKRTAGKKFVIVDAGMNDLIRPALYQSYHQIVPLREPKSGKSEKVDVVGPVCESGDFFAQDRELPPLKDGDIVALMSAGAYGFSMASTYNSRPLAAEVLVRGADAALIRDRQTFAELIKGEQLPEWAQPLEAKLD